MIGSPTPFSLFSPFVPSVVEGREASATQRVSNSLDTNGVLLLEGVA